MIAWVIRDPFLLESLCRGWDFWGGCGRTTIPRMPCAGPPPAEGQSWADLEAWLRAEGWDTVSGTEIDCSRFRPARGTGKPNREKYNLPTQTHPHPLVRRRLPFRMESPHVSSSSFPRGLTLEDDQPQQRVLSAGPTRGEMEEAGVGAGTESPRESISPEKADSPLRGPSGEQKSRGRVRKRRDLSPLGWEPRRDRPYPSADPSRCPGPASATISHQTPLSSSGPHTSCLDLWREKNDQLVRQAKVTRLLGPSLWSAKIPERGFPTDLAQLMGRGGV